MNACFFVFFNVATFSSVCYYSVALYIGSLTLITACTVVVSAMGHVNGREQFSTLHSSETPPPIFMKLEIYNYFPDTTQHAKFHGNYVDVGGLGKQPVWCMTVPVLFFPYLWTHPHAQYVIIRRSRQGSAFWGLERWNLTHLPPKNVKIGTLSWRSMENCSHSNSGR